MKPQNELLFLPLGGSGEIGMNVNLYGCQGKWLMVDLGMTFAGPEAPGVDVILPDLSFIEERRKDLVGIVITHGHEDHIGAIPYLAADLGVPIYATGFTAALIKRKLADEGLSQRVEVRVVEPGGQVDLGPFSVRYVAIAHSIPEGNGVVIETPYGRIFHTGDWKLDECPVIGLVDPQASFAPLGDAGILAMVCDSTNVFNAKESGSEIPIKDALVKLIQGAKGKVVVSTFASNVGRLHAIAQAAAATGRKIVLAGRSMDRITGVARETGYWPETMPTHGLDALDDMANEEVLVLATGCQGEPRAALARAAVGQHGQLKLGKGDLVILSSKNIPGNEVPIAAMINALVTRGVEVVTEKDAPIHVSGHPGRPELEAMYRWIRPQIAVPVHGEIRHMTAQAKWAKTWGVERTIVPKNGDIIRLAPDGPELVGAAEYGRLALDGDVIIPADGRTLAERRRLSDYGYVSATLVLKAGRLMAPPYIVAQGLPLEEETERFKAACIEAIDKALGGRRMEDAAQVADKARMAIRRVAREFTGKKPVAEAHIITL